MNLPADFAGHRLATGRERGNSLTVVTLNLEAGGWDGHHGQHPRLDLLPELIGDADLVLLVEGKEFGFHGQELRYLAEGMLAEFGLRSFMTRSVIGELHELVFARWPRLRLVRHYTPDLPGVFDDQIGWLSFQVDGLDRLLWVRSTQWQSWNGDKRLDQAQKITKYAGPDYAAVIGGDLNTIWPDCPGHTEFEPDWLAMPPHKRTHKTLPPGLRPDKEQKVLISDRRATQILDEVKFVNAGCLAGDMTPTVNPGVDNGQGARIDHLVFSPWLAPAIIPESYQVRCDEASKKASNHRKVSARLDLDRLRV